MNVSDIDLVIKTLEKSVEPLPRRERMLHMSRPYTLRQRPGADDSVLKLLVNEKATLQIRVGSDVFAQPKVTGPQDAPILDMFIEYWNGIQLADGNVLAYIGRPFEPQMKSFRWSDEEAKWIEDPEVAEDFVSVLSMMALANRSS